MKKKIVAVPSYTNQDYLAAIAECEGFLSYLKTRLDQIENLTPWPPYMYEQVEPYFISPPNEVLQAIVNLSVAIGNVNLRLDALYAELNAPVVK